MALFILGMIFFIIFICFLASTLTIVYDKGKWFNKKPVYIIITIYNIILAFLSYTALPINYTLYRSISVLGGVFAVISFILYFYKTKKELKINLKDISKIFTLISMIMCIVLMSI